MIKHNEKKPNKSWKKYLVFTFLAMIVLAGIGYATTTITNNGINTPTLNFTGSMRNSIGGNINTLLGGTGTQVNVIDYTNITDSVNNTDLYTIKGDTYSQNYNVPNWFGYRNVVSRVNSYDQNDIANFYAVWNDYGGSQGGNYWAYVLENPCNSTYTNCTSFNATSGYGEKIGYVVRTLILQRGNNKIGLKIDNDDVNNNTWASGIRFTGTSTGGYGTGIDANPDAEPFGYSSAFINARDQVITRANITNSNINIAQNLTGTYPLIVKNTDTVTGRIANFIRSDGSSALTITNSAVTVAASDRFTIAANTSVRTCGGSQAGDIYYDAITFKHYGCNSTNWNALY